MCLSEEILAEYSEVLGRAKFAGLERRRVARLLAVIAAEATLFTVSPDKSDNRFYECAAAARADYLVTGNAKHFNKPHGATRIVTARQLLSLLAPGEK